MKFTGRIKDIGCTLSGSLTITLEGPRIHAQAATELSKADHLDVEIKKHRKRRSLDANAYYWVLIGKIGKLIGESNNRLHNIMLDRYGELDLKPDGSLKEHYIPDDVDYLELSDLHLKLTQETAVIGDRVFRLYYQIKGSSTYDTAEMSRLIDGIVSECKEMGIETLPPEELERMMCQYGKKAAKRADG